MQASPQLTPGSGVPDRWIVPESLADDASWYDELGFVVPQRVPHSKPVRDLLEFERVIVTGEAWAGKTYLSGLLTAEARSRGRVAFLTLERRRNTWVPRWQSDGSMTQGPSWCVVDAVDEGVYSGISVDEVFETIRDAIGSGANLRLIVLSRNDGSLPSVQGSVRAAFGDSPIFRLLPLDVNEARRDLTQAEWGNLTRNLSRPQMRGFARYFKTIKYLSLRSDAPAPAEVWRGMFESLCNETRDSGGPRFQSSASTRVRAAERLAAVALLARQTSIDLDNGFGVPAPRDLFPDDDLLCRATSELRFTPLLERLPQGGYRFRYRFAEELLAALGTVDASAETLRALTTGPDGTVRDDLRQYSDLRIQLGSRPHVLGDSERGRSVFTLDEVRHWLDELLNAAGEADAWVNGQSVFRWLDVDGLEGELTTRLADPSCPAGGKQVLLDIGETNEVRGEFTAALVGLALDPLAQQALRERAAYYLGHLGSDDDVRALMSLCDADTAPTRTMRARVLQAIVDRKLSPALLVASIADGRESHLYDARAALVQSIAEALTLPEARTLVRDWVEDVADFPQIDASVLEELREAAVCMLCAAQPPTDEDVELIGKLLPQRLSVLRGDASRALETALRSREDLRRRLFAKLDIPSGLYIVAQHVRANDVPWLTQDAERSENRAKYAETLYRMRRETESPESGALISDFFLRHHALLAQLEQDSLAAEAKRKEWSTKYPVQEKAPQRPLRDLLEEVRTANLGAREHLLWIGALCFARDVFGRDGVSGTFAELESDEQAVIVERAAQLLRQAEPTTIPGGRSSFPTSILYESAVVSAVALRMRAFRSDPELVRKWSPTLLFDLRGDAVEAIRLMHELAPEVVTPVIANAIRDEVARGDEHLQVASGLPPELWTQGLVDGVVPFLKGPSETSKTRGTLLRYLVSRAHSGEASGGIRMLVEECLTDSELHDDALSCAAALDPRRAFSRVSEVVTTPSHLDILRPWLSRYHEPKIDFLACADVLLRERVADLLFRVIGTERERKTCGFLTVQDEARDLLNRLVEALVSDPSPDAARAVARLSKAHEPRLGAWRERVEATRSISRALSELEARWVPRVRDVVRALDASEFRFLRSEADLHHLVLEILRGPIATSIGHDLDLLYTPRAKETEEGESVPGGGRGARPRGRRGRAKPPPREKEQALQAYVRRRIEDLLPRYTQIARLQPELPREQQVQRRKRYDLLVVAGLPAHRLGCVVVEVKWSDNQGVKEALAEQLGNDYLKENGRSHGIYCVGLMREPEASAELLDDLERRRAAYLALNPGLAIDIVSLPLQWRDSDNEAP